MKKYVAFNKKTNKMILENWVNKFWDLPETPSEAAEVATYFGLKRDEFVVKSVLESEFKYYANK